MRTLFYCVTYHHLLVAAAKTLSEKIDADIIIGYHNNAIRKETYNKVLDSHIFHNVYEWMEPSEWHIPRKRIFRYMYYRYYMMYKLIKDNCSVNFKEYECVYLFYDSCVIGNYLNAKHINYHMIEDSKGVFEKEIMDTYTGIKKRYMCNGIFEKLLLKTNICPGVYGVSKYCRDIRVSSIDGLLINQYTKDKFIEENEQELFNSLTTEQINTIIKMFADNVDVSNINDAVLILTSPLVKDGLADNYNEQEYVYREIIKDYLGKKLVVIKPHPRDDFKYMDIFESGEVLQLERSFPSEILNYIGNNCFSEYITINSHSIYSFPNDKITYLGLDYLNNKLKEYRKSKNK